jgi:hypothetical protein
MEMEACSVKLQTPMPSCAGASSGSWLPYGRSVVVVVVKLSNRVSAELQHLCRAHFLRAFPFTHHHDCPAPAPELLPRGPHDEACVVR